MANADGQRTNASPGVPVMVTARKVVVVDLRRAVNTLLERHGGR